MSRIRSKDTKPELIVRKYLFANGFRYKLHDKKLPGKPDLVLSKYKTAIFIHGCFWHGHQNCRYFVVPKTRTEWWLNKITNNKAKDDSVNAALALAGYQIIEIWECELKKANRETTLKSLADQLVRNLTVVAKS
jgi:DNA mismatch endonuclease (patch repair protein)